jgi:hypothetical protein
MFGKLILTYSVIFLVFSGCEGTGFRKIEGANEKATIQSAQEILQQVELALNKYREVNHTYPWGSEATLYDTLRNYFSIPVDPNHIYKSERDQSNYISIGGRKNKIVYRYPATLGSGDYTLYWVGMNAIDEEGRGDDIFVSRGKAPKQLSRKYVTNFRGDSIKTEFALFATGNNDSKDSVKFQVKNANAILYSDWWPLSSYVSGRPELTESEKQETINLEFDRFLHPVHFISADTLIKDNKSFPIANQLDMSLLKELAKKNIQVFSYYAGNKGVRTIYWNPRERKINALQISK